MTQIKAKRIGPRPAGGMLIELRIARILGPFLLAMGLTEPFAMPVFAAQTGPVVYLNGTLLFVAGVAILQAYARWTRDWRSLVTLFGWLMTAAGLYRLAKPAAPQLDAGPGTDVVFLVLIAAGAVLSWQGYRRR